MTVNNFTLLEVALIYAKRDWPVFPLHWAGPDGKCSCGDAGCPSVGKHPRTKNGYKAGAVDPATIKDWWARCPNANIGIVTGSVSGIVVLDIDPRHGGDESLEQLQAVHGRLPVTPTVSTGGGGLHFYFRHPGPGVPIKCSEGKIGPGIDVRGDGGYAVGAPSNHESGKPYSWAVGLGEAAIAPIPAWLLEQLTEGNLREKKSPKYEEDEGPILEGQRNSTLTSLGGRMRHGGLDQEAIEAELLAINTRRCEPPLPAEEVQSIAASLAKYPAGIEPELEDTFNAAWRDSGQDPLAFLEIVRTGVEGKDALDAQTSGLLDFQPLWEKARSFSSAEKDIFRARFVEGTSIRKSSIDELLFTRGQDEDEKSIVSDVEPWPEPVDGLDLWMRIMEFICAHLVFSGKGDAVAVTAWVFMAHLHDYLQISPLLVFSSPEPQCGKSLAMDAVTRLVPRPLPTSSISPASLFRTVEFYHPSLLIDEVDTVFKENDDLRTIMNSGWSRTLAKVVRCVGTDFTPTIFSTWAPKVLALIGTLPLTLVDRSITIHMRRKLPGEEIKRLSYRNIDDTLCRQLARWAVDNTDRFQQAPFDPPSIPAGLTGRQIDNWSAAFTIADIIGGQLPDLVRAAARDLCASNKDLAETKGVLLLRDIKQVLDKRNRSVKYVARSPTFGS